MERSDLESILRLAVRAPSGDNQQPWRFRWDGVVLDVIGLPERMHPYLEFADCGLALTIGGLLKAIELAAAKLGWRAQEHLFPIANQPQLYAAVSFECAATDGTDSLAKFIDQRCTNRRQYDQQPLDPATVAELLDAVSANACRVRIITDAAKKEKLGAAATAFLRLMLENEERHAVLFANVAWTEAEERQKKEGLPLASLEFDPAQRFLFRRARKWGTIRLLNRIGFSRLVAATEAKLSASSAAVAVISVIDTKRESFFEAGKAMMTLWLKGTSLNLSMAPVTGTLFAHQRITGGTTEFLVNEHRELILNAMREFRAAAELAPEETPVFFFRIGRASAPSYRTSRKEPEIEFVSWLPAYLPRVPLVPPVDAQPPRLVCHPCC